MSLRRFEQLSDRLTLTETEKDTSKNKAKTDKLKNTGSGWHQRQE